MIDFSHHVRHARLLKWKQEADSILKAAKGLRSASDDDLLRRAETLQYKARTGTPLSKLTHEAFALVIETADRVRNERHYKVQVIGGLALMAGHVAQMQTGEGKTLTATLPAFTYALAGRGCHVHTFNDYLASRDAEEMGVVYEKLGLSVGTLVDSVEPESDERREQYRCDITYGTVQQFGFDFLRDRLSFRRGNPPRPRRGRLTAPGAGVQGELFTAVVDEADSILLDEAVTPLIIALETPQDETAEKFFHWADGLSKTLTPEVDFHYIPNRQKMSLTKVGVNRVLLAGQPEELAAFNVERVMSQVENSLVANFHHERDREYEIITGEEGEPKVRLIEQTTGRPAEGRQWSRGLHQAIEVKEQLPLSAERGTAASTTIQKLFRQYHHLCGMTGTAITSRGEFRTNYKLPVSVIPTNKPCIRKEYPPRIFATMAEKDAAIVDEVRTIALQQGRSVLIGTPSVIASERLSAAMKEAGVEHELLNTRTLEDESRIVAQAGQPGRVTVATNMAGRGTDIKLHPDVRAAGGLHVIATERHSSARIDRQLIGRAARQGDPGSYRIFLSYEDELTRDWPRTIYRPEVTPGKELPRSHVRIFDRLQRRTERENARLRKANLKSEKRRSRHVDELGVDSFLDFLDQI